MATFYLDLETYVPEQINHKVNPIITITYQQMDSTTGEPTGDLNILKSWESSEQNILRRLHGIFNPFDKQRRWDFIPIGFNLRFDFITLLHRWRDILGIKVNGTSLFADQPCIDIRPIVILFNQGQFKGASLQNYSSKKQSGAAIKDLYTNKDYDAIDSYIRDETDGFLKLYQFIAKTLPPIWQEYSNNPHP